MPNPQDPISRKLEAARRELLDLSLRNPLLNYRPLKSRGLEVIQELPTQVFRLLVREGKAMSFLPASAAMLAEEPAGEPAGLPGQELVLAPAQTDSRLQTRETPARLQARLLDTYHSARLFMEEQGINILYLALGTLSWHEAGNTGEARQAPLILVPVELERTSAREQFQLRYTGGEIATNLSLLARMKADFGLELPELPDGEELEVGAYFDAVWRQVVGRPGWQINSRVIALGFFSFGKFMMYNDLDAATWPGESQPETHPVVQALLQEEGFREPASHIPDEAHLDAYLPADRSRQVVDADSSQTLAILDVNQGRNLVIQGPPGTGKSQTITNLIAEAIGQGKTVLFVAEKMAALEVVKRRLDQVGLGGACLELHSHKTNKKDLLLELQHTLDLGKPQLPGSDTEVNLLTQVRNRLNDYAEAINTPLGQSGLTLYDIYGQLIGQRETYGAVSWPRLALPSLLSWSPSDFAGRETLVEEVQARLRQIGQPTALLFWGSGRRHLLPADQARLLPLLEQAAGAATALNQAAAQLAALTGLPAPGKASGARQLLQAGQAIRNSPDYRGLQLRDDNWEAQSRELERLLKAGAKLQALHQQYETTLIPPAWGQDLLAIRQDLLAYGDKWWRFLSGAYRRSKKQLAGLTRSGLPADNAAQLALVDAVLEAQGLQQTLDQGAGLGASLFGSQWRGADSNWVKLAALRDWVGALRRDLAAGKLPAGLLAYLAAEPDLSLLDAPIASLQQALGEHDKTLGELSALLQWQDQEAGASLAEKEFDVQTALFRQWQARPDELHAVVAWNLLADRLQDQGLQEILNLARQWPEAGRYLAAAFRQTWLEALLEQAYLERPALRLFDRAGHEDSINKFRHLDSLLLAYNRARLAAGHWQQLPLHQAGGQLGVLRREFEKKSRHLPIRQLMARAGQAIQAIKPVFMMGPLSIANYLPPGALSFDLVIFDEASQVKPVDAFGAILRARQVVVVGDSKQMPPTSFFDALVKDEEVEEEESFVAEVESVLGLFAAQGAPQRMLRWHYRSRHESLVAVSNQEFYDNRLVIFPSPDAGRQQSGLIYHHLPEAFYDRGKTRTNPREAEAVARAIMDHARQSPELTLGVAAFSMAQMQAIINQLEVMRRHDPSAEPFFAAHPHEPFFIKNLENVQGDERDVIFISIGYGRTQDGSLSMSFGPLNGVGGERRLNVLITRARRRCEVFTNLSADDIDLSRTQSRGVQAFKTFLSYAQKGWLASHAAGPATFGSPFEEAVYRVLTQAGYQVESQVGSAGFFIDLAVRHPRQAGSYLLGIECDGANYHRARSARDRDRLRQSVLESLGWHLYRIWSTDWFRNPEAEQQRLLAALEKALRQPAARQAAPPPAPALERQVQNREASPPLPCYELARPRVQTGSRELHEVPTEQLAAWAEEVVQVESPVHEEEVIRRLAEAAGVPRIGPRLRGALEKALALAVHRGQLRQQKGMYWTAAMRQPPLRDRSQLPDRNIAFIAPEEISLAIEKVVGEAFGMPREEVAAAVARLLGFGRLNEDIREQIDLIADQLVGQEKMLLREGQLQLSGKNGA